MPEEHVKVEGLKGLQRALARIDKGYVKEINKHIRFDVAVPASAEVRAEVVEQGLVGESGRLEKSIKPFVRTGSAGVRSSPPLNPGPKSPRGYAPIYEFAHGGERAFMRPVFVQWAEGGRAEHEMTAVLDWAQERWGQV